MDNARSQRGERQDLDIGRYGPAGEVAGLGRLGMEGREVWMGLFGKQMNCICEVAKIYRALMKFSLVVTCS